MYKQYNAIEDNKMFLISRHEQLSRTNYCKKRNEMRTSFAGKVGWKELKIIATTG